MIWETGCGNGVGRPLTQACSDSHQKVLMSFHGSVFTRSRENSRKEGWWKGKAYLMRGVKELVVFGRKRGDIALIARCLLVERKMD